MRLLEIGHLNFIKEAFPEETRRVDTSFVQLRGQGIAARLKAIFGQFAQLCEASFTGRYDAVFCRCLGRFIYRKDIPMPVNVLRLVMGWLIQFCVWVLVSRGTRLAVIDHLDELAIDFRDDFLLKRCHTYFKREIPQNTWNVFLRVQPPHGEFYLLTRDPRRRRELERFAPLSLGITAEKIRLIDEVIARAPANRQKDIDVFYAGPVEHSTVRESALPLLEELTRRGYRIESYVEPIPFPEFVDKINRAWLVLSPEGQGWDCYRHYEACVAGSVPLINHAGIRRHRPLVADEHCIEYALEGDDLCRRAEAALADRPKLLRMAAAAREHVLKFHTHEKLGRYMVAHTLQTGAIETGNAGPAPAAHEYAHNTPTPP